MNDAEKEQVRRLHTADEFGAWCCHCAKAVALPHHRRRDRTGLCQSRPISGAVCQKPEGHMGGHGGMTKEGSWRNW